MLFTYLKELYQVYKLYSLKRALENSEAFFAYLMNLRSVDSDLVCYLVSDASGLGLSVEYDREQIFSIATYNNFPVLLRPIGSPRSMSHSEVEPYYSIGRMCHVINEHSSMGSASLSINQDNLEVANIAIPMQWSKVNIKDIQRLLEDSFLESRQVIEPALMDLHAMYQSIIDEHDASVQQEEEEE